MKKSNASAQKKSVKKSRKVNSVGLVGYVGLSSVVFVNVYFFLNNAIKSIVYVNDSVLMSISVFLSTFMSFGSLLFLTKSTMNRVVKIMGIVALAMGFLYLNVFLSSRVF
jgi:hypothetical protein